MLLEWEISRRYLKSKRKESFVTFISWFAIIGIMLGVAVLIIVMSVMNGFRKEIISSLIGANGHIALYTGSNIVENYDSIQKQLVNVQGVTFSGPTIEKQVLISSGRNSQGALVWGLTLKDLQYRKVISKNITPAQLNNFNQSNSLLLGRILARDIGAKVGDNITVISPDGYVTAFGTVPKILSFKVIGIINTGLYQYDSNIAIIPLNVAQDFFGFAPNTAQKIDIFTTNPQTSNKIAYNISKNFRDKHIYLETWQQSNSYLINALEVERNVMFMILSLVILIAAFNIVSGLVMLVRSKTKEIAILRTIGLGKKSIIKVFLLLGIRIGVLGTALGTILGVVFSLNIESIRRFIEKLFGSNLFAEEVYFLSRLPADVKSYQVLLVIFIALLFTIISSIYPAILASRIKPVEGLKYE